MFNIIETRTIEHKSLLSLLLTLAACVTCL